MKKIIIMGATSGLGRALAERFIQNGWTVGAAGRKTEALDELKNIAPDRIRTARIDILSEDATDLLSDLIRRCGGMDIYLHCSGIALLDSAYSIENEVRIAETNAVGFTRMVTSAYNYYESTRNPGRLVAISSIAGIRGLEALPAYSASKSFDSTLLEALRQRADSQKLPLRIVDIKPGWTRTPLLAKDKHYLWEMDSDTVTDMIYKASLTAHRSKIIGLRWKLLTTLEKCVPSFIWEKLHIPIWH